MKVMRTDSHIHGGKSQKHSRYATSYTHHMGRFTKYIRMRMANLDISPQYAQALIPHRPQISPPSSVRTL